MERASFHNTNNNERREIVHRHIWLSLTAKTFNDLRKTALSPAYQGSTGASRQSFDLSNDSLKRWGTFFHVPAVKKWSANSFEGMVHLMNPPHMSLHCSFIIIWRKWAERASEELWYLEMLTVDMSLSIVASHLNRKEALEYQLRIKA